MSWKNISRTYYIARAACGGCESARAMDFSAASSRPSAMEKRAPPSSKTAAKAVAVNRGAREGPAQLMSMSSTEEASPFTFRVCSLFKQVLLIWIVYYFENSVSNPV